MERITGLPKQETTAHLGKRSRSSTLMRLKLLAELIGVTLPSTDALKGLGAAVSCFSDEVIDKACQELQDVPQGNFRRMPTPYELIEACRNASIKKTRWCGRCTKGNLRGSDGVIRRCECCCTLCDNSGWTVEARKVPRMPYAEANFAVRCPNGCRVTSTDAV